MNPHLPYRRTAACSHVGEEPLLYYHDWQVLEQCDGIKPGSSIGSSLGITEAAVTQALERLLEHGLVRAEPISYGEFWHASQNYKVQTASREQLVAMEAMASGISSTIASSISTSVEQLEKSLLAALEKIQAPSLMAPPPSGAHPPQGHPQAQSAAGQQTVPLPPAAASLAPPPPKQAPVKPSFVPRAGVTSMRPPSPAAPISPGFGPQGSARTPNSAPMSDSADDASVPATFPVDGQKLKPLVDAIVNKAGGGTKGQLAVYRVFLKVPSDLLKAAGVGKLSLIDQNAAIKDPVLWETILRATMEVAGLEYNR
ncbi:MAG: hypothetical protein ACAI35_01425 [Candidatus Methylacidiphilales bacterium]|nr:hypothetical protein [Candidatus Methylacidiphilales bacterium]